MLVVTDPLRYSCTVSQLGRWGCITSLFLRFHGGCFLLELYSKAAGGCNPEPDHTKEHSVEERCRSSKGATGKQGTLLDKGATRLTEWVADDIDGGLALGAHLSIQRDIRRLL